MQEPSSTFWFLSPSNLTHFQEHNCIATQLYLVFQIMPLSFTLMLIFPWFLHHSITFNEYNRCNWHVEFGQDTTECCEPTVRVAAAGMRDTQCAVGSGQRVCEANAEPQFPVVGWGEPLQPTSTALTTSSVHIMIWKGLKFFAKWSHLLGQNLICFSNSVLK